MEQYVQSSPQTGSFLATYNAAALKRQFGCIIDTCRGYLRHPSLYSVTGRAASASLAAPTTAVPVALDVRAAIAASVASVRRSVARARPTAARRTIRSARTSTRITTTAVLAALTARATRCASAAPASSVNSRVSWFPPIPLAGARVSSSLAMEGTLTAACIPFQDSLATAVPADHSRQKLTRHESRIRSPAAARLFQMRRRASRDQNPI